MARRFAAWLAAACACAQTGPGELSGSVLDESALPVASATVELRDSSGGSARTVETSATGAWHFLALPPGSYRVTVTKEGFRTLVREPVRINVANRTTLELTLQIGEAGQSVEVRGETPLLRASTGTVSFTVEQRSVVSLPLDGRNFVPLIALLPGVSLPPGLVLPRINGSRPRTSEYLYDGISVLQPEPGQAAYYPIVDAIEEFGVQTNSYSAEFGRSNGGVIQVATRRGSDDFHGTLFEFFRNEALNARNLFAAPGPKPRFRRNQYGGVLGGPVRKGSTHFFVAWQGTRLETGVPRISTLPTNAQRGGVFAAPVFDPATTRAEAGQWRRDPFPRNIIAPSRIDPIAARLIARYPAAEGAANNYRRNANESTAANQFDFRLDHAFGPAHRIFSRYSPLRDHSLPAAPLPDGSGRIASGVTGETQTRSGSFAFEHGWTLSPRAVNQVRLGFTRRGFVRALLEGEGSPVPNVPVARFAGVLPTFDLTGFQQLGPSSSANGRFTTAVIQAADTHSRVMGAHVLKFGADLRWERLDALQPPNPAGLFQFDNVLTAGLNAAGAPTANTGNAVASFLLGQVQSFSIDAQRETLRPRAAISEFFVQDDWKATRSFTVNTGVRYTINWPSTEANDRAAVFDLQREKLAFAGRDGVPRSARDRERFNFAPRLGLAFRATDTFAIRAGYGLTWIEQAGITTPFTAPMFPFIQTLGQRSLDNRTAAFALSSGPAVRLSEPGADSGLGQGVFGVQRNNGSGYAQQWNWTLQRTFGREWSAEAGYLGSKLTRLGVPDVNLNQLRVEQLALGSQLTASVSNPYFGAIPEASSIGGPSVAQHQLLRPYPRFTTVALYRNNVGHSTYHSLQARLERRFSRGLSMTASYTLAKLIDDAGAVFDSAVLTGPVVNYQAADSFNRRLEKDESTGSSRHAFSSGWVWEIGRGWQVAGILRLQSGMPFAVTQATNLNAAFGFGIQRPNRIGDPNSPAARTTGRWFDTGAFTAAPQFTLGNSSRNPVRGPAYRAADLMVGKTFPVGERMRAELRAEAFNVTDTPPLGQPNGSFGTAAFGSITTALDPRVFEFVVKFHF